jgi:hypothetical protein
MGLLRSVRCFQVTNELKIDVLDKINRNLTLRWSESV